MTDNAVRPRPLIQVINSIGWGGREQLPVAIHRYWQKQGRDVRLMVGVGTEMARRSQADTTVESLPTGRLSFAVALRHRIRRYNPAAVICHFTHDLPAVRIALMGRSNPSLLIVKHLSPGPPRRDWVHRFLYRRVNRLLAVSEFVRAKCVATYPIANDRVSVWYPGVDIERFAFRPEARRRVREAAGVSDQDYVIGYAARITPKKGFEDLLQMMKRLRDHLPEGRLWLIGGVSPSEKAYERELKALIHEIDLDSIINLIGHQDQIEDYLCALDLFVTPSREESFGLTTVEAMAGGRPIVGFRAAGTAEIVVDGQTGLLAEPKGELAANLTQLVLQMARQPELASAMGIAARDRAAAVFSREAMMQRLDSELQS